MTPLVVLKLFIYNTQNNIKPNGGGQNNALSWNYDLLSSLGQNDGCVTGPEATLASKHYGAYAHTIKEGLRIISINTDFVRSTEKPQLEYPLLTLD